MMAPTSRRERSKVRALSVRDRPRADYDSVYLCVITREDLEQKKVPKMKFTAITFAFLQKGEIF